MRPSWQDALRQTLRPDARVAIVGIGHELCGDDAAGVAVARALRSGDRLLVVDAGPAPENVTGALRRFRPDVVLLVDAAQMGEAPGAVRLIPWQDTSGLSASTHTLPPYVLARYLAAELGCDVALLGIQPAATAIGAPLSQEVERAVAEVAGALAP